MQFIIFALLFIFSLLGLYAAIRGIYSVFSEGKGFKKGPLKPQKNSAAYTNRENHTAAHKRKGSGLRFKLTLYTDMLLLCLIFMISAPSYCLLIRVRQETLLKGLRDRSTALLDGLSAGVKTHLRTGNTLELGLLTAETAVIPEARYITITGAASGSSGYTDYVWATNDPEILSKIDTPVFRPGFSRLSDPVSPYLDEMRRELNEEAEKKIGRLSEDINELTLNAILLAQKPNLYLYSELANIEAAIRSLETTVNQTFFEMTEQPGSVPHFDSRSIQNENRRFIFYKPVMYRHSLDKNYFRGLIRLEVSVDSIAEQITKEKILLLRTLLIIALAALVIGVIGSFILSSLLVRPLQKLVRHAEIINDTMDMEGLSGLKFNIGARDEIALLGDTINDMTRGLVKAAYAASDLSLGREVQKKLLPLDVDSDGNRLNTGYTETDDAVFFGYYEGAKEISGDYFDYRDLGDGNYAIIKCDIAGMGIPAAGLMLQVATMFINYFRQWKSSNSEKSINELVYQINGFIESMGFENRFAAFALCLFNTKTGKLNFCNAGDNIIHIFDSCEKRIKSITLNETPAAGILPNSMVVSKGSYKVQTMTLNRGDILLLYTDGIEEAKRNFRDSKFNKICCGNGNEGTIHGNHLCGQWNEEIGQQRVYEIINAVMNRGMYNLHKWHSPEEEQDLHFDFSDSNGGVDDLIMALIAVEKIFRCYYSPSPAEGEWVLVDKKIDAFLKVHFLQYGKYCLHTQEYPRNNSYIWYTHLREDEQYDDLAILGIKRKGDIKMGIMN